MTYYEQLVKRAAAAMKRHPRSTIAMDAETFEILCTSKDPRKVAARLDRAVSEGRTPVILEKPRKPETWIL
ncbi:MAG: hypothetical protein JXR37_10285 [Kiritimatiellae bacterium]|nr:hypothetical protein [Kiritimatiellia bacterium]